MKACDMALRLKAHTAEAAMLFLNVRKIKKGRKNPTEGDERMERMNVETERHRSKC